MCNSVGPYPLSHILTGWWSVGDSLSGSFADLEPLRFAAHVLQMLEVSVVDGRHVAAAEQPNLKGLVRSRRQLGAGRLQVVERLVDHGVGANQRRDGLFGAVMRDQLTW